jgi:hypothetical protein
MWECGFSGLGWLRGRKEGGAEQMLDTQAEDEDALVGGEKHSIWIDDDIPSVD